VLRWRQLRRGGPRYQRPHRSSSPLLAHTRPSVATCDNGPEFIAEALRHWCDRRGSHTLFIEPGLPWQNAYVESYNDKQRRELLNAEVIDSVLEAQILIDDWRVDYNTYRPHQSLGYLTPAEFARRWGWRTKPESHKRWTDEGGPVNSGSVVDCRCANEPESVRCSSVEAQARVVRQG
jgi:Integrase core domain